VGETAITCAILMPSWPILFLFFLFVSHQLERAGIFSIWDATSKLHNITENGQTPDTIAGRHPAWLCRCVGLWYRLPHDLAPSTGPQAGPFQDFS
jgi:hypothetical protein